MEIIVITFIIVIGGLGLSIFLCMAGGKNAFYEKYKPVINSHKYTVEEYIQLYNYCVCIRNHSIDKREKWDKVLDKCNMEYEQNYYTPDYNKLCSDLLNLLYKENYSLEKINFGIIDKNA